MKHTLRYVIEVDSAQKAVAVRDKLVTVLEDDDAVEVVSTDQAAVEQPFTIKGYDTKTDKVEELEVNAPTEDEAQAKAETENPDLVVVTVE